jgi:polyphosphate kinase
LNDPRLLTNRELSWLECNDRVLAEAFDERNPILERVRFVAAPRRRGPRRRR